MALCPLSTVMSVDLDWTTLTGGPEGKALSEAIKDFVHDRFQQISLPKLIRSVQVHEFEFGNIAPRLVLKDICDPLPDFYESQENGGEEEEEGGGEGGDANHPDANSGRRAASPGSHLPAGMPSHVIEPAQPSRHSGVELLDPPLSSNLGRGPLLGTTSNLGYFHLPLSAGLSGTVTPLAAVAGAHFQSGLHSSLHPHGHPFSSASHSARTAGDPAIPDHPLSSEHTERLVDITPPAEPSGLGQHTDPDDLQLVFHVTYSGDVRLSMTADVFLDYPMPSFVGIPLKINITGITFNGVGLLARIKQRAHLSFLSPEDADSLVGGEQSGSPDDDNAPQGSEQHPRSGGLLEEIKIESEMGETSDGKQGLKNVGKIEKFILEQVQRIFEDEVVYPSFWTFLI